MNVILLKDVKGLGKKGDVVKASDGYARNFLLPRNLATEATDGSMKVLDQQKQAEKAKKEQELQEAKKLAEALGEITVEIKAKSGEGGRLFGSVTGKEIADILEKKHQVKIDKRKISLPEPIRTLGITQVEVKVYPGVTGTIKVHVIEE